MWFYDQPYTEWKELQNLPFALSEWMNSTTTKKGNKIHTGTKMIQRRMLFKIQDNFFLNYILWDLLFITINITKVGIWSERPWTALYKTEYKQINMNNHKKE